MQKPIAYRLQNYDNGPHDIDYFKGTKQFLNQFKSSQIVLI